MEKIIHHLGDGKNHQFLTSLPSAKNHTFEQLGAMRPSGAGAGFHFPAIF